MIKKTLKIEDLDGNTVEVNLYFNLNQKEVLKLLESYPNGLEAEIDRIQKLTNPEELGRQYRDFLMDFIERSYGERRPDNLGLTKSPQIMADFEISPAYDALLDSLGSPVELAQFIIGIMPKAVQNNPEANKQFEDFVKKANEAQKSYEAEKASELLPPPPPVAS